MNSKNIELTISFKFKLLYYLFEFKGICSNNCYVVTIVLIRIIIVLINLVHPKSWIELMLS